MLKYVLSLTCVVILAASCLKNEGRSGCPYVPSGAVAPQSEITALETYLDTNNITAVKHPSGFYYEIVTPGTGTDSAGLCSQIQISYLGKFINGNQFDKRDNVVYVLGALIDGWQKGIPLIKKGGKIKLYIPPTLGYGSADRVDNQGNIVIPRNSILLFDVSLIDYTIEN